MFEASTIVRGCLAAACTSFLAACAPSSYLVKAPTPSGAKFESMATPSATTLTLTDSRRDNERTFHSGLLGAALNVESGPIDPPEFFARHLQAELTSRGIQAQVVRQGNATPRLDLQTFRVQNHRASGYSPFVTFTYVSADVDTGAKKTRVGAFIKRGKVPVWSFEEVIEPTFNQPLSLAVKEIAAKVARELYGARSSDKAVDDLVVKLSGPRTPDSYLDVYALGFTNNPKAINAVAQFINDPDEHVRLAAISSLGTLRAVGKFDELKSIYFGAKLWQDRAMALKSIGDLSTDESGAFLTTELKKWETQPPNNESAWNLNVLRLYTRQ